MKEWQVTELEEGLAGVMGFQQRVADDVAGGRSVR